MKLGDFFLALHVFLKKSYLEKQCGIHTFAQFYEPAIIVFLCVVSGVIQILNYLFEQGISRSNCSIPETQYKSHLHTERT